MRPHNICRERPQDVSRVQHCVTYRTVWGRPEKNTLGRHVSTS